MDTRDYRTPRGNTARLFVRPGTNDGMMAESSLVDDEYGLASLDLDFGTAVDVGAHIGQVAVGLALDYPNLRVLAVEPVPENVELLRKNIEANGVADRVEVVVGAAASAKATKVSIAYAFEGGELETMHRFVGNQAMPTGTRSAVVDVPAVPLSELVRRAGGTIALLVTDCEGGEYGLLSGTPLRAVLEIRGEYHDGYARLARQLERTHDVEQRSGSDGFGAFVARLRR